MKQIIEDDQDLKEAAKQRGVNTVEGNKVSEDGRLFVGSEHAGKTPFTILLEEKEEEDE